MLIRRRGAIEVLNRLAKRGGCQRVPGKMIIVKFCFGLPQKEAASTRFFRSTKQQNSWMVAPD